MTMVKVSSRFEVVIPKNIRDEMQIKAGQKVNMTLHQGRIELTPIRPMKQLRGLAKGIDTNIERDEDRL